MANFFEQLQQASPMRAMGFDTKKLFEGEEHTIPGQSPLQKEAGQKLSDIYKKYIDLYQPGKEYSGLSTIATPTSQENQGLGLLSSYLSSATPEVLNNASKVVNDTLSGSYDPYSSNYYSGMRRNLEKERNVALSGAKRSAAKYGYRTSSIENKRLAQVDENMYNKLSDIIAGVAESERVRQLNAVPFALQVSEAQTNAPLKKIQASQQYGGLSRLLENIKYQDFLRKQKEYLQPISMAENLYGTQVTPDITYQDPSLFTKLLDAGSKIASTIVPMMAAA